MPDTFCPPYDPARLTGLSITVLTPHRAAPGPLGDVPARVVADPDAVRADTDVLLLYGAGLAPQLRRLSARPGGPPPAVVLAPRLDWSDVTLALESRARGYLLENRYGALLPHALLCAVHGGSVLDPAIAARQIRRATEARARARHRYGLTRGEHRLMELLCAGRPVREIAAELSLTPETVRNRLSRIYRKMAVDSRSQAILRWLDQTVEGADAD